MATARQLELDPRELEKVEDVHQHPTRKVTA